MFLAFRQDRPQSQYQHVTHDETEEPLLEDGHGYPQATSRRRFLVTVASISVFLNFFLITVCAATWASSGPPNEAHASQNAVSLYSPANTAVEYILQKFTTGSGDDLPIYEHPPSEEVDQAWFDLHRIAPSAIHEDEAALLPNSTWAVKGNREQYIITLDVFHQLHCLDILRQSTHREYYDETQLPSMEHIRHCIGAVRQALMCAADITPIVWQWDTKTKKAEERDDVVHVCRDFGRIRQWAEERWMTSLRKEDFSVYALPGEVKH